MKKRFLQAIFANLLDRARQPRALQLGKVQPATRHQQRTSPNLQDAEDLHHFTQARFVANETQEMAQRYARFNLEHLGRVAAQAVHSQSCVKAEKFSEGQYNKVLLLAMNNGKEVIAKIPNLNAGQAHFTTASEVATMHFVRDNSKIDILR